MLLRIGNAAAGLRFRISKWVDHYGASSRAVVGLPDCIVARYAQWLSILSSSGFECTTIPMSAGTLFSNVLLVANPA